MHSVKAMVLVLAVSLLGLPVVSGCDDSGPVCGNGIVEEGEECDDGNLINNDGCTNKCLFPPWQSSKLTVRWYLNGQKELGGVLYSYDTCIDLDLLNTRVIIHGPSGVIVDKKVLCSGMTYTAMDSRDAPFENGTYYAELVFYDTHDATVTGVLRSNSVSLQPHGEVFMDIITSLDDFTNGPFMGTFYFELSWNGGTCEDAGVKTMKMVLSTSDGSEVSSMEGECIAARSNLPDDVPAGDDYVLDVVGYTEDGTTWGCFHAEDIKVGAGIGNPSYTIDVTDSTEACR